MKTLLLYKIAKKSDFPWQEKLVAPLIAKPNWRFAMWRQGDKKEGKKTSSHLTQEGEGCGMIGMCDVATQRKGGKVVGMIWKCDSNCVLNKYLYFKGDGGVCG